MVFGEEGVRPTNMNKPIPCRRCSADVSGKEHFWSNISYEFLCETCWALPEEKEREERAVAEMKIQDEADHKVDIYLAERLDGHHVVGWARCSFYDGCPMVHGESWDDLRRLPVFVKDSDWNDPENYYREEIYRPRAAVEYAERLEEMMQKHPEYNREEMAKALGAHDYFVDGWHVHALEPVYNYTGDGHQTQRILTEMKKRGWYVAISSGNGPDAEWAVSIDRPATSPKKWEGGTGGGKSFTRAVAYAAARALGMT